MKKLIVTTYVFILPIFLFAQWQQANADLPEWGVQRWGIHALDNMNAVISVGCSNSSLFKTTDGGVSWIPLGWPLVQGGLFTDLSIINNNTMIGCNITPAKILGTSNGGNDWYLLYDATQKTSFFNYLEMFDESNGIAMGDALNESSNALLLRTTDGGQNWISIDNNLIGGISGDANRRIDFVNQDVGYFYDSYTHKFLKTTDGGNLWIELFPPISFPKILKFYSENIGYLFGSTDTLARTTDAGVSWVTTSIQDAGYGEDIEFLPSDPSKIWLLTRQKLFFSNDAGLTWQMDPLSNLFTNGYDLEIVDGVGWLLCEQVYKNSNPNQITLVIDDLTINSNSFKLYQNYPNPFNPSTKISWQSPVSSWQTLKIYDVLGNEITTLVNEEKSAGTYEVDFNASSLPSGVYFYQLVTEGQSVSRKMILLR